MDREYSDRLLATTGSAVTNANTDPQAVLHASFDAIIRGDFDAFGASLTDDVELSVCGFGPLDGSWRERDAVVAAIEGAEARKAAIHAQWCEPGFYEKTPPAEVAKLEEEEQALGPKIDGLIAEWEALEAELARVIS